VVEGMLGRQGSTPFDDAVHLSLPPSPVHLRVARVTAAAVADRFGFGGTDADDVSVAVNELTSALMEAGPRSDIALEFTHESDRFMAEGNATVGVRTRLSEVAQEILDLVVDRFEMSQVDDHAHFRAVKRSSQKENFRRLCP
jgi:hypothetical protein